MIKEKRPPRRYRAKVAFGNYLKGQILTDLPAGWAQVLRAKNVIEEVLTPPPPPPLPAALVRPPIAAEAPVSRQIKGYMDRKR